MIFTGGHAESWLAKEGAFHKMVGGKRAPIGIQYI